MPICTYLLKTTPDTSVNIYLCFQSSWEGGVTYVLSINKANRKSRQINFYLNSKWNKFSYASIMSFGLWSQKATYLTNILNACAIFSERLPIACTTNLLDVHSVPGTCYSCEKWWPKLSTVHFFFNVLNWYVSATVIKNEDNIVSVLRNLHLGTSKVSQWHLATKPDEAILISEVHMKERRDSCKL